MIQKMEGCVWRPKGITGPAIMAAMDVVHIQGQAAVRNMHRSWALDYCLDPGQYYRVRFASGRWHAQQAGVAHLYPPGTPYWEQIRTRSPMREAYVTFWGGEQAGLDALVRNRHRFVRVLDSDGRLAELLRRAALIGQTAGEGGFWEAQAVLCRLLGLLSSAEPAGEEMVRTAAAAPPVRPSQFALAVEEHLRRRLAEPWRLSDLARKMHVSDSTLLRRFRHETGRTPIARLIEMRIDLAKGMLLKGYRLKTIAEEAGFCDAYHLSKTFKKREGVSPRDFLRLPG